LPFGNGLPPDAKICAASLPKSQILNAFVYNFKIIQLVVFLTVTKDIYKMGGIFYEEGYKHSKEGACPL
jgi:hypothetical protein